MVSTEQLSAIIGKLLPAIDLQMTTYIADVLKDNHFDSVDDVNEAIGELVESCSDSCLVDDICGKLFDAINVSATSKNGDSQRLLAPVQLSSMTSRLDDAADDWKSIWTSGRDKISTVDQKKLEKAETKLKQKADKRDNIVTDVKPIQMLKEATANQMTSKRDVKSEARGSNKTKDIKVENFDLAFGDHVLLSGAQMTLGYGRRYGLCGRNGIGKSTLLRMISNRSLMIPSHISILHVEQEVIGDDTKAIESVLECDFQRHELLKEEKQLSLLSEPTPEQVERLSEVYQHLTAIEADKAPAKASIILSGLGFTHEMQQRATKTFSGGWRMRIALARALFSRPDLLLLDEPTNMLDMKAIIWLEQYLINEWESTLLVVSHDRTFLASVPTDVLHFHSHRIDNYKGNYEQFVKSMTEKLKNQIREYEAQQQYRQHVQEFIDKFRYNAKRASLVQSKIKALERLEEVPPVEREADVILRFPEPEALTPPVLQLDEVTFGYDKSQIILNKISLNTNLESRICIVGDNGSGKTTLLKLLIGDLEPTSGIRQAHRTLSIGYFSQHHVDQLSMNLSPLQFMATKFPGKTEEYYRGYLGRFGITGDLSLQSMASLSGGQKSRVAFANMTLSNPHLLILDEPTNHLDVETVEALAKALNQYKGGVILVTHDQQLIEMVCKELWYCNNKSVTCLEGGFTQYRHIIETDLANIR
ncbi:ATP-binding cassette sub-family F member 3-like [Oppia nitens]|uniref:ATP-binding cassette sub-family F member 3-like n=1 Tax=Oppia nitens TaxID=1686743 RepID=UPI0023DAE80A|nr:ATP-binding cassette sub-family F member 3-like [Oppia nitens]